VDKRRFDLMKVQLMEINKLGMPLLSFDILINHHKLDGDQDMIS